MLTDSQRKTYHFIQRFIEKKGYAPKLPEIAAGIGIKSIGVVHRYVQALVKQRLITLVPHRHRSIQLVTHSSYVDHQEMGLPLIGKIAAGQPLEAISDQKELDLAGLFAGRERYALVVKGSSMIDEGIFDGDIVICERCDAADNGAIVVALIDRNEATLKRIQHNKDGTVTLLPANSLLKPQTYAEERIQIQGIFIGLIRKA